MSEIRASTPRKSSFKPRPSQANPEAPQAAEKVEAPKKAVSIKIEVKPLIDIHNDPLYNEDGTRNTNIPFCLYATRKVQEERENNKKIISLSDPSCKEKVLFQKAFQKMKAESRSRERERCKQLRRMAKSKAKNEAPKYPVQPPSRQYPPDVASCPMSCPRPPLRKPSQSPPRKLNMKEKKEQHEKEIAEKLKAMRKARSKKQLVKYPPVKTRPWKPPTTSTESAAALKKKSRPTIAIPPFKTRKWTPEPRVKPKEKVVIEYPPVTRKPWKPMTMSLKKQKPRMRLEKVFYPFPASTLGRRWHYFKCMSKIQILRGHTSQYSKKFNYVTNGKQSTFIAAVALSLSKFCPMADWKSDHIDEIMLYGDINCRRQIRRNRHQSVSKPSEISNKIYLRRAKVLTEFCERVEKGCFEPTEMIQLRNQIKDVLNEFSSLIVTYCGQAYALWSEENGFFILNSEDTDEKGKLVQRTWGAGCAIRSTSLNTIIDYLVSNFKITKQRYEICSFRVDKVIKIEEELAKLCPIKKKIVNEPKECIQEIESEEIVQKVEMPERPKSGLAAILFRHPPEPIFSNSFQRSILPDHGFLTCEIFLLESQENRAPFISSVSILMLRVCKSSLWQSTTLMKIFEIGHALFVENVESHFRKVEERKLQMAKALTPDPQPPKDPVPNEDEDDDDDDDDEFSVANIRARRKARMAKPKAQPIERKEFPITEFDKLIVQFGNLKLEMSIESAIMGKVMTRKPEELSLRAGLESLFKKFDVGLVIGPESVAVWREQNYFFMFDPNHCHQFKRASKYSENGNSCLSWFKNLSDLAQLYISNLQKEKRSFMYKICKVEAIEFIDKAHDWENFKSISNKKWILSGKISESSEEFNVANRNHQSTCIALIALAKSKDLGLVSWTTDTVDEIVRLGDEFHTGSVVQLKEKGKLVDPNLSLNEVGSEFKLDSAIADFYFEESVVYGKLHENDGTFMSLATGLSVFFDDDDMGVVMAAGVSQAVLKFDDAYFLFDSHARDNLGRNLRTLDPVSSCKISGCACVLRFKLLSDLATHFIANLEIGNSSTYTINKVEVTLRSSNMPCLFYYKPFGKGSNAAILRAFEDWHEDAVNFKSEIEAKTFCNLFAALCFTRIVHPNQWNRMDINEILKIGYKMLCNVASDPSTIWENLANVEICGVEMVSEKLEPVLGIFKAVENILPEIDRADETIEEHIEIAEIERRESERKPKDSKDDIKLTKPDATSKLPTAETTSDGDGSSIFPPLDSEASRLPLLEILNSWSDKKEVFTILTSSLFHLAIFKMNRVYFVFDPKASNDFGALVVKRYEDFIKRFLKEEFAKLLDRNTVGGVVRRPSKEQEFEELIFGRPVKFGTLTLKPSQYVISINNNNDDEDEAVTVCERGDAYVAWFITPELTNQHILSKIPEKFRNQPFTMHTFSIVPAIKEILLSPWNNFEAVKEDHWILRATLSQNDSQFPLSHRNNQDVPNCLMSMMFARLCNASDWNSTVLDVILKLGDRLFKKSLTCQIADGPISPSNLKLNLSQMELPVFIRPFIINVEDETIKKDMMVKSDDQTPLEHFKQVIGDFLTSSSVGLLVTKKYYVSIWKSEDNGLMMFDPHDIGPDGTMKSTGFACLQRFLNHVELVDTFWHNIKNLDGLNEFELIKINLIMDHYNGGIEEEFDNKLDVERFTTASSTPCLPKTIRAKATQLRNDCVEMTICFAIATLCVSQSLDPEYYTPDIIDRIILLGNELSHECLSNDECCFKDFDLQAKSSCPDEINWNFQLNDTFASIQMDIFQRGIISKHPCPLPNLIFSLEEFFNFYSIGLLISCEFIAAMWKEDENYFIFYACPIDEAGKRSKSNKAAPGLVNFKSVFDLYNNILSNTENKQAPFELRNCSILMSDVTVEENPCEEKLIKKPCKTQIILPAVAKREEKDSFLTIIENSIDQVSEFRQHRQDMIVALKQSKREGFLKYQFGGFMCGSISRNSKSLNEQSRKYHAPAICILGAAMSALKEASCWSSDILDAIIISGNSLYIESSVLHRKKEVDITNVVSSLCIGDNKLTVKVEPYMDIQGKDHLAALLKPLFKCRKTCYITKNTFDCWLLMKLGNFIFLFDPLGITYPGKKKSYHRATLYRFDSIERAVPQIIECMYETWEDEKGNMDQKKVVEEEKNFEIGGIDVKLLAKPEKPKPVKEEVKVEKKPCRIYKEEKSPPLVIKERKLSNCSVKISKC